MTADEFVRANDGPVQELMARHRQAVELAMLCGKHVPDAVLASHGIERVSPEIVKRNLDSALARSKAAFAATVQARRTGAAYDHVLAGQLHAQASEAHGTTGMDDLRDAHAKAAEDHQSAARDGGWDGERWLVQSTETGDEVLAGLLPEQGSAVPEVRLVCRFPEQEVEQWREDYPYEGPVRLVRAADKRPETGEEILTRIAGRQATAACKPSAVTT